MDNNNNINSNNNKANWGESKSPTSDFASSIERKNTQPPRANYNGMSSMNGMGPLSGFYGNHVGQTGLTPPYTGSINNNTMYATSPAFPSYHGNNHGNTQTPPGIGEL